MARNNNPATHERSLDAFANALAIDRLTGARDTLARANGPARRDHRLTTRDTTTAAADDVTTA